MANNMSEIVIKGATQHNLKGINVRIPRNQLVVFTGVSGSGKSSLLFDTIYAEAQRQYLESVGSFIQQRIPTPSKPDVEEISGLSSPIVVDQKPLGRNPRSTVGTVTEIYTLLRLLYSREGKPRIGGSNLFSFNNPEGACKSCKGTGEQLELDLERLFDKNLSLNQGAIQYSEYRLGGRRWNILQASRLFDMDKPIKDFSEEELNHLLNSPRIELSEKTAGFVQTFGFEGILTGIKRRRIDKRGQQFFEKSKSAQFFESNPCSTCNGSRLNHQALGVKVQGKNIAELGAMYLTDLEQFLMMIESPVATPIIERIVPKLDHLIKLGIGYLSINRPINTLSGGESQRVKLARQLGSSLIEQLYILDEPSVGLHAQDIGSLTEILKKLRDTSNSVLVVEHDPSLIREADYIVDIGPGAGLLGGRLMYAGDLSGLFLENNSLTSQYLARKKTTDTSKKRQNTGSYPIANACIHNLKNITIDIPLGIIVCVTGVAGSGKSSLILEVFAKECPDVVLIDQAPVGRSSRSNPTTYTGIFDNIRTVFARENKVSPALFSFNSSGACSSCKGLGYQEIEMHFLDSVRIICPTCGGKQFTEDVLRMQYKQKSIYDVLRLTVEEALHFFVDNDILEGLGTLREVGLSYLTLGQPLNTLSGGEAQRVKLSKHLQKKGNVYVLDEPTTGLHMADIDRLMHILHRLVDGGNSVVVIEHNLDVIAQADWIIDMGPGGGEAGGTVVAQGTPEQIAQNSASITGQYLL
jgi:excinuclease UvrABC ATPase subunit